MAVKNGGAVAGAGSRAGGRGGGADIGRGEVLDGLLSIEKSYIKAGREAHEREVIDPLRDTVANLKAERASANPPRGIDSKIRSAEGRLDTARRQVTNDTFRTEFRAELGKQFAARVPKSSTMADTLNAITGQKHVGKMDTPLKEILGAARTVAARRS